MAEKMGDEGTNGFNTVKKRDGTVAEFDRRKITGAISKAVIATRGTAYSIEAEKITDNIIKAINVRYAGYKTPDVEGIQDIVEQKLMEAGLFDVAKAYILYRERHKKLREDKEMEMLRRIREGQIHVIKRDGRHEQFSVTKILAYIERACVGYEGVVDIQGLLTQCELGIYDNIKTRDIAKLAVMSSKALIERDPAAYSSVTAKLFLNSLYKEALPSDLSNSGIESAYSKSFAASIRKGVEQGLLCQEMLSFDLDKLSKSLFMDRDELINYRGLQTLYDRYFLHDKSTDLPIETPQFFWMRVAMGLSLNEPEKERRAVEFYEVLSSLRFVCSTPTLFHSGTLHPQMSSCYLTTIEDSLDHIFKCIGDNAQLSKWSGGLGNDWTNLRSTGALIKGTNVESQGIIPFLKIANDTTVAINRSGKRRGATCAYLETWHLDIEDFIDLRKTTGDERRRTQDMDTAHWIPDLFMQRVSDDGDWTLFSPDEVSDLHHVYGSRFRKRYEEYEAMAKAGKLKMHKVVKARALWRRMVASLFETSHPWMVFKDPSNIRSPQDHAGVVHSSNLCTEITLNTAADETAVCNLGSVNLVRHVTNGRLDVSLIRDTVVTAMRMLDNVIDLCYYPTIEAKNSNARHRPVGLGIMGYQDTLYMLNINFDSEEQIRFADESMELIAYHAILASSELAAERGAYSSFKGSKWDRNILPIDTIGLLESERGIKIDVNRSSLLDWGVVRESIKKNGMRNSNCMAIAPTATISNIANSFPSIEPIYKNLYVKSNMSGEFTVVNQYLVEDLKRLGLWNRTMLEKIKESDGDIQRISLIPGNLRQKYKEAFDIAPEWLIRAAAHRAKWIDQSQSLNIFTKTSSGKELSNLYLYAWRMGLKSTYYLRTMGASAIEKSTLEVTNRVVQVSVDGAKISPPEAIEADSAGTTERFVESGSSGTVQFQMQMPAETVQGKSCKIDGKTMDPDENCEACQ